MKKHTKMLRSSTRINRILALKQITLNQQQLRWAVDIINGKRHFELLQKSFPAASGKTFFIDNFIKPWNKKYPNDQITYKSSDNE